MLRKQLQVLFVGRAAHLHVLMRTNTVLVRALIGRCGQLLVGLVMNA